MNVRLIVDARRLADRLRTLSSGICQRNLREVVEVGVERPRSMSDLAAVLGRMDSAHIGDLDLAFGSVVFPRRVWRDSPPPADVSDAAVDAFERLLMALPPADLRALFAVILGWPSRDVEQAYWDVMQVRELTEARGDQSDRCDGAYQD